MAASATLSKSTNHPNGWLVSECWCGRKEVLVRKDEPARGVTRTCGAVNCNPIGDADPELYA